jgi:hypothetical protein
VAIGSWWRTTISPDTDLTPPERLIPPIPRASAPAAAIVLACVALLALAGLSQGGFFGVPLWVVWTLGGLLLLAAVIPSSAALHVTTFSVLVVLSYRTIGMGIHPFPSWARLRAIAWWCWRFPG